MSLTGQAAVLAKVRELVDRPVDKLGKTVW